MPNDEIVKRIDSDVLIVPYSNDEPIGFFSSDILYDKIMRPFSCFMNSNPECQILFGHYESGSVLLPRFQGNGLYSSVRSSQNNMMGFDFYTTRTQNPKVHSVFEKLHPDINRIRNKEILLKNDHSKDYMLNHNILLSINKSKNYGIAVAKYLNCESDFDEKTFICKNAYDENRSSEGLIDGIEPNDGFLLLGMKNDNSWKK